MITRATVDAISRLHSERWPIISFYLRLDKERIDEDYTIRLRNLLREAEDQIDDRFGHEQQEALRADLEKIEEFFRDEASNYGEGVALFVSSPQGVWDVHSVPNAAGSQVTIGPRTNVAPLIRVLELTQLYCTCLISRDQARIFLGALDQIEEVMQSRDESVPGQHEQGGWSQARFERHINEHVHQHFKRVAEDLFQLSQERPYRYLILGAPDEVVSHFLGDVHPYVKERYIGTIHLRIDGNINEVQAESLSLIDAWRTGEKERVLTVLRNEVGSHDLGTAGLEGTVEALRQGQVMTLVLDESYRAPGGVCSNCEVVLTAEEARGGSCPVCGAQVRPLDDIVPEVVVEAFRQDAAIIYLEKPELQQETSDLGHIGAILRFRVDESPTAS